MRRSPHFSETFRIVTVTGERVFTLQLIVPLTPVIPFPWASIAIFVSGGPMEAGRVTEGGTARSVDLIDAMVAAGVERFGGIDVLVNNAGINVFSDPLKLSEDDWARCLSVDLEGAWHCARAVLPHMLARGAGSIVNIASVHGHKIIPGAFPYPVAKHGLIGLTRALGIEYAARGIRVNSISPGLILTPIAEAGFAAAPDPEAERRRQAELLPCKRIGEPEEVAYTALFLASDEARFINATDILIDGGRSLLYHE